MRIGELSERAGVSTRTLRHYEELGLLPARRLSNGYRAYDERDLRLLAEIRELTGLGFSLAETRPFLDCLRAGHPSGTSCPDARAVHRRKVAELDGWISRLQAVRAELAIHLDAPTPRCALDLEEPR